MMISAGSVVAARSRRHGTGGGAIPTPALHSLRVCPIPTSVARAMISRHHYLHSYPGATQFSFGVFVGLRLKGALLLGCGSAQAHRLVEGAKNIDCATLTRLWLADDLPSNSESRVIAVVLRSLRRHTSLKFLVSYADPTVGHVGTIYQASGWLYTGLSQPVPMYDLGDGILRHNRSVSTVLGTRNTSFLNSKGIEVKTVAQSEKHRYVYFLDPSWRGRLTAQVLPYPWKEISNAGN
jgi:hypothetical protein